LLVSGIKDIENRPRRTHFRGRILIHASAKAGDNSIQEALTKADPSSVLYENQREFFDTFEKRRNLYEQCLIRSAIIGSVEIVYCVENHPSIWAVEGQYHYVIANPILFDTPITGVKGQLGLWNYDIQICGLCGQPFGPSCVE